jgi:hypothetical protein
MQIVRKIEPFEFEPCIESQFEALQAVWWLFQNIFIANGHYQKKTIKEELKACLDF